MPVLELLPLVRLIAIFALVLAILLIIARWKFPQSQEDSQHIRSFWRELWDKWNDRREDVKEHTYNTRALHGTTALLVDPDEKSTRVMSWQLESHGCSVVRAKNGSHGLSSLQRHEVSFIIADALLPDISAIDFYKSLPKQVPLIFVGVTENQWDELRSLGRNVKCFDKPYDPEEVANMAGYMLRRNSISREV